jgi:hypothetical protein
VRVFAFFDDSWSQNPDLMNIKRFEQIRFCNRPALARSTLPGQASPDGPSTASITAQPKGAATFKSHPPIAKSQGLHGNGTSKWQRHIKDA